MTTDFRVEPLVPADAAELAALHFQVWREAYAGMVSQDYFDGMQLESRVGRWRQRIQLSEVQESQESPDGLLRLTRLARHTPSGRIVGFCSVGAARDEDAPSGQELTSMNVLAEFHGSGVGRQLVETALGERAAYLWVVRQNARAIAFYRKLAFAPDGGTKHDADLDCDEIRMVRATPAADAHFADR